MGRARQIAGRGNNDSLVLDSSAASTDVGELLLLNGTDASSSNDGFSLLQEDATDNAFDAGPFVLSEAPISVANPAFKAFLSASQTGLTSSADTKVNFDAIEYDVGGYYDNTTNYRYTPLVAGYYHIVFAASCGGAIDIEDFILNIVKNDIFVTQGRLHMTGLTNDDFFASSIHTQDIIHMNGTTDYLHCSARVHSEEATSPEIRLGMDRSYFSGLLLQRSS